MGNYKKYICQNKANVAPKEKRKPQTCCFCKNHGILILKKDHKNRCEYRDCECEHCLSTKHRQLYSAKEKKKNYLQSKKIQEKPKVEGRQRKEQQCRKCFNHEKYLPMRDHKKVCPYRNCNCEDCDSTIRRRKLVTNEARTKRQRNKSYEYEIKVEDVEMEVLRPSSPIYTEINACKLSPSFEDENSSPPHFPSEVPWNELPPIDELLGNRPQVYFKAQINFCYQEDYKQSLLRNLQYMPYLPELNGQITLI